MTLTKHRALMIHCLASRDLVKSSCSSVCGDMYGHKQSTGMATWPENKDLDVGLEDFSSLLSRQVPIKFYSFDFQGALRMLIKLIAR